jgi:putative glutamine amidotransferase
MQSTTMQPVIGLVAEYTDIDMHGATHGYYVATKFYVQAVRAAGGVPVVVPHLDSSEIPAVLARLDGIVLCGGIDIAPACYGAAAAPETNVPQPARDAFEMALIERLLVDNVPTLGVCRGVQSLNVALGGTLHQHLTVHPTDMVWSASPHTVDVVPGSLLASVTGATQLTVNSLHHQAVDRLGRGVVVTGRAAADGGVEAIEIDGAPNVLAVQWHPEVLSPAPEHLALFENLVETARAQRSPNLVETARAQRS